MRARRSPSPPNTADADAFSADLTVSDLPDMIDPDAEVAPRASSRNTSLTVCLSCGSSPGTHGECEHPEVADLAHAPAALRAAAQRLAQAVQEKRSLERTLRKLVAAEVASGSATVRHRLVIVCGVSLVVTGADEYCRIVCPAPSTISIVTGAVAAAFR